MNVKLGEILRCQPGLHVFLQAKGWPGKVIWQLAKLGAEVGEQVRLFQKVVAELRDEHKGQDGKPNMARVNQEAEKLTDEQVILRTEPIDLNGELPDAITPDALMLMMPFLNGSDSEKDGS